MAELNPYAPPAAPALAPPAPSAPPEVKMRRPASVKWLIAVCMFSLVAWVAAWNQWRPLLTALNAPPLPLLTHTNLRGVACLLALLALLFAGRRALAYWIGTAYLGYDLLRRGVAVASGWSEAAPEAGELGSTLHPIFVFQMGIDALLLWLFIRFAFGRPSWLYFRVLKPEGS